MTEPANSSGSRRIAAGTAIRAIGEIAGKAASLVFFVAVARELGENSFGDVIFALALATILFRFAGFGTDQLLTRELARDRSRVAGLLGDAIGLKLALGAALLGLMTLALWLAGYEGERLWAMVLLGAGTWIETIGKSVQAVIQAWEQQRFIAASLVVQRLSTALGALAVLWAGGGLFWVSVVFAVGATLGLASAWLWMQRSVVSVRLEPDRSRWAELARAAAPLGVTLAIATLLHRLDATLLGFLAGGTDNAEVGAYGAAVRIVFATTFLTWAFAGAAMPWLSRDREEGGITLARGYELGLKALTAGMLPLAVAFGLLAEPLIELFYGDEFGDAVIPMRIFAGMTLLYALNSFNTTVMISRGEPGAVYRVSGLILVQNLIFNLILIPPFGATAAAANATFSSALLAIVVTRRATAVVGRISISRFVMAPLAGSVAMAAVLLATGLTLHPLALIAAGLTYAAVAAGLDHLFYRDDLRTYLKAMR